VPLKRLQWPVSPCRILPTVPQPICGVVAHLAQAAYDERQLPTGHLDSARLTVLADALEEAGCDNATILTHCRQPGEHVRGCWVVDLLLNKS
jgi:hypothetical protein